MGRIPVSDVAVLHVVCSLPRRLFGFDVVLRLGFATMALSAPYAAHVLCVTDAISLSTNCVLPSLPCLLRRSTLVSHHRTWIRRCARFSCDVESQFSKPISSIYEYVRLVCLLSIAVSLLPCSFSPYMHTPLLYSWSRSHVCLLFVTAYVVVWFVAIYRLCKTQIHVSGTNVVREMSPLIEYDVFFLKKKRFLLSCSKIMMGPERW